MALTNAYVIATSRIPDLFNRIRDGQAPERVTQQLLQDWGFASTNDRAFIPLLKGLGFLTADGKPTQRYTDYRDHSRSKAVLGEAIRESYGDLFLINDQPTQADKNAIEGKFKSFHNQSDNVAGHMTKTFYALLGIADIKSKGTTQPTKKEAALPEPAERGRDDLKKARAALSELHYNVQIHLPATKDVEVYNAIFKSLREHLFES